MWLIRNIFFYVLNLVVFLLSCANYLNQFVTTNSELVYLIASCLLGLIVLLKLRYKWTGILTLNRNSGKYNLGYVAPLSRRFVNWTVLFYSTEIFISFCFGILYFYFDRLAWMFSAILLFNAIEGILFLVLNIRNGNFKLGINENALVHNARGTYVIPFHDLKSIEYKYDEFFFIYNTGETLTIPENIVDTEHVARLREILVARASEKGVFYSEKLRPV